MAFHFLLKDMMRKIMISMIRQNWNIRKSLFRHKKNVLILKGIQIIATKMVSNFKDLTYEENIKKYN